MRAIRTSFVLLVLALAPAAASAVTVDQIVALSKAGISEPIILALIDRDKSLFSLEADQLVKLQREGVSEKVVLAMLKSGRDEADAQTRADSSLNAARILSSLSSAPDLVIVGHGPDIPNTRHYDGFYSGPPFPGFYSGGPGFYSGGPGFYSGAPAFDVLPVPYGVPASRRRGGARRTTPGVTPSPGTTSPALCIAQIATGPVPPMVASKGFVTVCPPQLQPRSSR
jgi:hypothetical protein